MDTEDHSGISAWPTIEGEQVAIRQDNCLDKCLRQLGRTLRKANHSGSNPTMNILVLRWIEGKQSLKALRETFSLHKTQIIFPHWRTFVFICSISWRAGTISTQNKSLITSTVNRAIFRSHRHLTLERKRSYNLDSQIYLVFFHRRLRHESMEVPKAKWLSYI